MKLIPLFDGELRFDEATEVAFPSHGEDGDWLSYVQGDGAVSGERVVGDLRWTNHPRRRADGTWLPHFEGVIKTTDSAEILFSFHGYNQGIEGPLDNDHRTSLAALTLASASPAYQWVNQVFGVIEADVRPSADPERWWLRAYECVSEITANGKSGGSPRT